MPNSSLSEDFPVVVEATRGGIAESRHRGALVAVTPENTLIATLGNSQTVCFLRSAAKPFQALQVVTSGTRDRFAIQPRELAVISGSHNGEPFHVECVTGLLDRVPLPPSPLQCGIHPPFNRASAAAMKGQSPTILNNNCSGKHTGMLAIAVHRGLSTEGYELPNHPVQLENQRLISLFSGFPEAEMVVGVDGCTVPTWALPLHHIALAYARLANPEPLCDPALEAATRDLTAAMLAFPEMVGGTDRIDTDLMRVHPGKLISKVGADGVQAIAVMPGDKRYPTGLGITVKIEDGDNFRARNPFVLETLEQLGILSPEQTAPLKAKYCPPILDNRKRQAGELRPVFRLTL